MFLCRPFQIDQIFFIVFSSFFLLPSFAFAKVYVRAEYEGVTSSTAGFQYKGVMDFNNLEEKEFESPRLDFDTKAYFRLRGKPVQVIGAAYQNSFTVVSNTDKHGGSEKVGKHVTMPNNTAVVPMVAGTRGNNYFGFYWAGIHPSNRVNVISNDDAYEIHGSAFKPDTPSIPKNVFAVGESNLPHVFVNIYCSDCQFQRIIFYTGDGHPFHTDQHTIGWYTDIIKPTTATTTASTTTTSTTTTTTTTARIAGPCYFGKGEDWTTITTTTSTTTTSTSTTTKATTKATNSGDSHHKGGHYWGEDEDSTTTTTTSTTTTSTSTTSTMIGTVGTNSGDHGGEDEDGPRLGGGLYYGGDKNHSHN